jgi:hypothetical protein
MSMTVMLNTQNVNKVEKLAEKRRELIRMTLSFNVWGSYSGLESSQKTLAEQVALQKEIEILESEVKTNN